MDSLRRRDFLARGAAAAGAAALGASALEGPGVPAAGEGGERPVRIGVAGTGNRGRHLIQILLGIPGVEVRALCDLSEENARNAAGIVRAAGRPEPAFHTRSPGGYEDLLARQDSLPPGA